LVPIGANLATNGCSCVALFTSSMIMGSALYEIAPLQRETRLAIFARSCQKHLQHIGDPEDYLCYSAAVLKGPCDSQSVCWLPGFPKYS